MLTSSLLPLVDFKTILVSTRSTTTDIPQSVIALLILALLAAGIISILSRNRRPSGPRRTRKDRRPRHQRRPETGPQFHKKTAILIDGSNVMHWLDEKPQLKPLVQVVRALQSQGYTPGVVFDANAGHKLVGRFLNGADFATMLSLPRSQVLVVPRGTQADPVLLDSANEFGARIVTNDRFRDWAEAHPKVLEPGFLIRGGMRDGKLWLQDIKAATGEAVLAG